MSGRKVSMEDIESLIEGVAILGTGGGGSPEWGRKIMENDFKRGREYTVVAPEDVENDALVVSGGIMGSVKKLEEMDFDDLLEYWEDNFELEKAFKEMEKELDEKIDYIVPFEMGGLNTPVILSLGARLDIPVIDGDALGRAAPETQMTSFIGHGVSLTPMPLIDYNGNVVVVREAENPVYPDQIGRWIVTRGGGLGANNHYPMSGEKLKESVVPDTISWAIDIGEKIIEARDDGKDPVQKFNEMTSAYNIFHGRVSEINEEAAAGFYFTEVKLEGLGDDAQSSCRFIIKNETMACWKDGQLQSVFPDLLCMLEPGTARGIMSVELEEGLELKLSALPCHTKLREALDHPEGKTAFSPERYGQDIDFIPVEELQS